MKNPTFLRCVHIGCASFVLVVGITFAVPTYAFSFDTVPEKIQSGVEETSNVVVFSWGVLLQDVLPSLYARVGQGTEATLQHVRRGWHRYSEGSRAVVSISVDVFADVCVRLPDTVLEWEATTAKIVADGVRGIARATVGGLTKTGTFFLSLDTAITDIFIAGAEGVIASTADSVHVIGKIAQTSVNEMRAVAGRSVAAVSESFTSPGVAATTVTSPTIPSGPTFFQRVQTAVRNWLGIGDTSGTVVLLPPIVSISSTGTTPQASFQGTGERVIETRVINETVSGVSQSDISFAVQALETKLLPKIRIAALSPDNRFDLDDDVLTIADGPDGYVLQSTGSDIAWVATSSLGISGGGAGDGSFSTTSTDYYINSSSTIAHAGNAVLGDLIQWNGSAWVAAATSTLKINADDVTLGATNLFYTNTQVQTYLDTLSKGYFFATSSADYWKSVSNFFSTTSADYWKSTTNFFSTTSADAYINASSTIARAGNASWGNLLYWNGVSWQAGSTSTLSIGNVTSTSTVTDNAIARFDGTTGQLIQNSAATIDDTTGLIRVPTNSGITSSGNLALSSGVGSVVAISSGGQTTTSGVNFVVGAMGDTFRLTQTGALLRGDFQYLFRSGSSFSSGSTDTGLARLAAGALKVTDGSTGLGEIYAGKFGARSDTTNKIQMAPAAGFGLTLASDMNALWFPSTDLTGSADTGISRSSAGVLRVSNGSSGGGSLMADYFTATSTTATSTFSGNLALTGRLADGTGTGGDSGMVLQSTGTGVQWVMPTAGSGFSTTSADYWKSVSNFFSTTSVDYWQSVRNFFSTTSADHYINSSSTIASASGVASGNVLQWDGVRWVSVATTTLGISGGSDMWVDAGSFVYPGEGDYVEVSYINATSTAATSTFTNISSANAEMTNSVTLNGQTIEYWDEVPLDDPYKLKDWFDGVQGAGRTKGGQITGNPDGTVDVAAGEGIVHVEEAGPQDNPLTCATCGMISEIEHTSWATTTSLVLADNAYNYIYYDYETGTIKATTDFYSISFTREFTLGRAYRTGTDVVVRLCGTNIWNFNRRVQLFGEEVFPIIRASGMTMSEVGTRGLAVTGGVLWAELVNRFTTEAFTTASDSFSAWHRNGVGGWTETTGQTQLSNTLYDDGDGTLGTVSNARYAVHFIYVVHDSTVHSVYGQVQNYTLNEAEAAQPPASIPGILGAYGTLIGKIIILKNGANFTEIQSAFETVFTGAGTIVHNDTSGLQGGAAAEYYHLTGAEYTGTGTGVFVRQNSPVLTGLVGIGTSSPFAKLAIHAGASDGLQNLFVVATSTLTSTTTAFVIDRLGNVGIGSSTPNSLLTVSGTSSLRTVLPEANLLYDLGSSTKRWNEAWVGTMNIGTSTWSINNGSNGRLSIYDAASGGGTERFSILSTGYVGIGTTTPTTPFMVAGTSTFAGQIVSSAIPLGTDVSQGTLYVNPSSFTSSGLVSWTAKVSWNIAANGTRPGTGLADLDGDGDLDLLLGREDGFVVGYENTGSVAGAAWSLKPAWDVGFDFGFAARPALADLDNDGDYDLIVGDNTGTLDAYENTGSASSPTWAAKVAWNIGDVGTNTSPDFVDFDNDGDYDLLIGDNGGTSLAYTNTGSVSSPTWSYTSSFNVPDIGTRADPSVGDLDGDGDYDLMIGSNLGVVYGYENTGTVSAPTWTAKSSWDTGDLGEDTGVSLADLDNDGDFDLMSGSSSAGPTVGYENTGSIGSSTNTLFGVAVDGSERFKITGQNITASGYLTLNNYLNLTYSGIQAAATIRQNGTGDILNIFDASTEAFTILDGGNVGIGSSTPTAKLSLKGNVGIANIFEIASSTDANILTVTGTGNVGIGTSTPSNALDVFGSINVNQYSSYKQANQTILYASSTNQTIFIGKDAGRLVNASGNGNTALGYEALYTATSSSDNTAIGNGALRVSVGVGRNTAVGATALYLNTYGYENTAIGWQSSALNITGSQNTTLGVGALGQNNDGSYNVALGTYALSDGTSPDSNVAVGANALKAVTTGTGNVALGYGAGWDASIVNQRSTVDEYMMFLGYGASRDVSISSATPLSKSAAIGYNARVATSSAIVLGGTGADAVNVGIGTTTPWRVLSVKGTVGFDGLSAAAGTPDALCLSANNEVTVNTGAQTCTVSSLRFKHDVSAYEDGLATINALNPSIFIYNDSTEERIGLIAEEVEKVDGRLIFREADGTPRGVRYEDIVAVLVKAVQELSEKIDTLLASAVQAVDGIVSGIRKLHVQEEICIGGTCVNETQLQQLLESASVTRTPPAEQPPVEEPPAEEPPVVEPPVEEPPAEEPPIVEEPAVVEPSVEEPPADAPTPESVSEPQSETTTP